MISIVFGFFWNTLYRKQRNEIKRKLRFAEQEYVKQQIRNNSDNKRCMWKTIRALIPKKSANGITYRKDDKAVANEFNAFYSSVGQKTVEQIKRLADQNNYDLNNSSFVLRQYSQEDQFYQFSFRAVECKEVGKEINSMPSGKAPGYDNITLRVLKNCLLSILPVLTSIINVSFATGTFPTNWKMAEVIPILKQGDHEVPDNSRPIALLPMLSKVCERIALNQFLPYLELYKPISTIN